MKKVLFVLSLFMAGILVNAQAVKTDFSGTWNLNAEKSIQPQSDQGGGGIRMGGGDFVAIQGDNLLAVETTRMGLDGKSTTTTMKYTLDGIESINTSPRGDSKSVAKWSSDGKSLTIETSRIIDMNGEPRTMRSLEEWTLTDAETLTVAAARNGPDGEVKGSMVYDKK